MPPHSLEERPRERRVRNRSRQRDLILAWLRASKSHPTAAGIYEGVRDELPNLSLATVYRNLDLLEQEGRLRTLHAARAGGVTRAD